MKLELLTDATLDDDAIRFVTTRSNTKLKPPSNDNELDDNEESKEPDYDEIKIS
jgi:hypothetical protein